MRRLGGKVLTVTPADDGNPIWTVRAELGDGKTANFRLERRGNKGVITDGPEAVKARTTSSVRLPRAEVERFLAGR